MFDGRKILIASMHKKEEVIAPLFLDELGLESIVLKDFDTDIFGTFTGEIERQDGPITTLRKKTEIGMLKAGVDLVIASEGSFGQHPTLFFLPAADEILLFCDRKNHLEIMAREVSTDTNFGSVVVQTEEELFAFADKSLFPSHALILSAPYSGASRYFKGISSADELLSVFNHLKSGSKSILVQTDMRAMYNPTRMKTISKACRTLIQKIKSTCPICGTPGFSVMDVIAGLCCSLCGHPTKSTLAHKYACKKCAHEKLLFYPSFKFQEDPTFCDYCNP